MRLGPAWPVPPSSWPSDTCSSIAASSDLADVPPATVYRLFSSKHVILKALFDVSIVGDHDDAPMGDRPAVRSLLAAEQPQEQLAGFVTVVVQVNTRIAPLYGI